jgi:hypothetical protein
LTICLTRLACKCSTGFLSSNGGIRHLQIRQDKSDQELIFLLDYLKQLNKAKDVRDYNKSKLRLHELIDFHIENIS